MDKQYIGYHIFTKLKTKTFKQKLKLLERIKMANITNFKNQPTWITYYGLVAQFGSSDWLLTSRSGVQIPPSPLYTRNKTKGE